MDEKTNESGILHSLCKYGVQFYLLLPRGVVFGRLIVFD